MNNPPHDPVLNTPPCATLPLEKTRWFEDEVHAHDAKLKSYLRGSFPSVDAEDIAQESYMRTWIAGAAKPIESAKSFLFTVARHLAVDSIRRKSRSPIIAVSDLAELNVLDEGRDAAETAAINDEIALMGAALAVLPARCREIVILRKINHIPQREVASRLGVAEGVVEVEVCRGIRRMEKFFNKHGVTMS